MKRLLKKLKRNRSSKSKENSEPSEKSHITLNSMETEPKKWTKLSTNTTNEYFEDSNSTSPKSSKTNVNTEKTDQTEEVRPIVEQRIISRIPRTRRDLVGRRSLNRAKSKTEEDKTTRKTTSVNELDIFDPESILVKMTDFVFYSLNLATKASEKDPQSIIILVSFACCILMVFGFFQPIVSAVASCAYPVYMSFKALNTEESEDDKKWLVYWCVFGVFRILYEVLGKFIRMIPYSGVAELVFFIWLFHDLTNGAQLIYDTYLRPTLSKHEKKIDEKLNVLNAGNLLKGIMNEKIENVSGSLNPS